VGVSVLRSSRVDLVSNPRVSSLISSMGFFLAYRILLRKIFLFSGYLGDIG